MADKKTFKLEILAADHPFYDGECEHLVFPTIDGLVGILPNHEPTIAIVSEGEIKYFANGEWHYAACSSGYVVVEPYLVRLLADSVELPEEIDVKRAEAAKQRAEDKLRQQNSVKEFYHTQAALNRAMNRLKVSSKHFKQ